MNVKNAEKILEYLGEVGAKTLCLCPGGRNAPFVELLSRNKDFEVLSFYDERSAGFFALGKSRNDSRPVAILTTSGTAVTELMSAVVEAHYSETPLIIISADRPKRLRGTGAPQSMNQAHIFSQYAEVSYDFEGDFEFSEKWGAQGPMHINICFDEPLIDEELKSRQWKISKGDRGAKPSIGSMSFEKSIAVIGALDESEREFVEEALADWKGPIYAEVLSGLHTSLKLKDRLICSGDKLIVKMLGSNDFKSVLRLGDVPVGRFWRDLDKLDIPVTVVSSKDFLGLEKGMMVYGDLQTLKVGSLVCGDFDWSIWKTKDLEKKEQIKELFRQYPKSEAALYQKISLQLDGSERVYLGNSLPIRLWDMVDCSGAEAKASRGVNGIDGQISTALGFVKTSQKLWVILGDLTTLYDFSGFWMSSWLRLQKAQVNFVVMNNQGGKIFSRIFDNELFENQHSLNFKPVADMWGWEYLTDIDTSSNSSEGLLNFIELKPQEEESQQFWKAFDQLWKDL